MSDKKIITPATYEYYVKDTLFLLKDDAKKAKRQHDLMAASNDSSYWAGYLSAFHNVISLLQAQADTFGIPLEEIALNDIVPEVELLAVPNNCDDSSGS